MRTVRSSSRREGAGPDPPQFPLGCGPGPDPPQFPPWVWAWTWSQSISCLGVGLDVIPLNFPLGWGPGCDPLQFPPWVWAWTWGCGPEPDAPQFPPWVWVWTWSPSTSPLGVGLETPHLGAGTSRVQAPPRSRHPPPSLWTEFLTHACVNIILPQTSFAGGKYSSSVRVKGLKGLWAHAITSILKAPIQTGNQWQWRVDHMICLDPCFQPGRHAEVWLSKASIKNN